jgi:ABC-2 type transport system ATP-binding protein
VAVVASEAEAIVRFRTNRSDEDLGEVLAELIRGGIRVAQFRAVVSDLEDAFLTVTRNEAEAA